MTATSPVSMMGHQPGGHDLGHRDVGARGADHAATALRRLQAIYMQVNDSRQRVLGYPVATDIDYRPLGELLGSGLVNNIGDPFTTSLDQIHVHELERDVVEQVGRLFRAPDDVWGYVTSGSTEGNDYGLWLARTRFADGIVYHSAAAHYSIRKACTRLRMARVEVAVTAAGEMDYAALAAAIAEHPDRAVIVVATAGTTMTEAVDDLDLIAQVLDAAGADRRHVQVDAALSGIPLALLHDRDRPAFDFAAGADTLSTSGYKFLGTPMPCGIVLAARELRDTVAHGVSYIGGVDSTIAGSRSGHAVAAFWYGLHSISLRQHVRRAEQARATAAYACDQLTAIGWPAWRNRHAFTIVLRTPPPEVVQRWSVAPQGDWAHVITMPGIPPSRVDAFVADLQAHVGGRAHNGTGPGERLFLGSDRP